MTSHRPRPQRRIEESELPIRLVVTPGVALLFLAAARRALEERRRGGLLALGLFALSPVPSAQLFEAAGLARLPLLPFTAAFFAGRIVSYTIYGLTAKTIRATSLGEVLREAISSPLGIALQVAMLGALVLLARIDWSKPLPSRDPSTGERAGEDHT